MRIYPAIDIKSGKCVRLVQGDFSNVTVYSDDPVQVALKWVKKGAEFIHLVDLDGARAGNSVNRNIIIDIAKKISVPVQLGGGIRSIETIKDMIEQGIKRVILGTSAIKNFPLVKEAVRIYGKKIAIGVDAKNGMVAVEGWEEISNISVEDIIPQMQDIGVKTIIYTDITKDGMLKGPNIQATKDVVKIFNGDIIASGGVSCVDDIDNLRKTGVEGVIIGKALYTGNVELEEILKG
jgi:phosphoribosylformimino-5-aminoimidazole carboxamide ribotide isomerase